MDNNQVYVAGIARLIIGCLTIADDSNVGTWVSVFHDDRHEGLLVSRFYRNQQTFVFRRLRDFKHSSLLEKLPL